MKYPEFRYVDLAMNGVNNRNTIVPVHAVKNYQGHTDSYMTYFRYNDEMLDHFQEKKSVGGYQGQAYADWLPIDIDCENLQEALFNLQKFVQNLEDYEIDINVCRFYFSGSKGFHVMIPSQLFGACPSNDIHKRFRNVATILAKGIKIDTSIYDKTRIFRLPNTINSRSNLFKVELHPYHLFFPIENILNLANSPVERRDDIETEFDVNEELKTIYEAPIDKPKNNTGGIDGVKSYLCMKKLNEGVSSGERDNVGIRVAAHLKRSGLSKNMMWGALESWNELNDPPLETYELQRIYDQALTQQYEFGCHDYLLKANCDKKCVFYKEEWSR